jgi:hypothetical protein
MGLPAIACAFDPYGTWMRPSTGTQVSFYDCGAKLCAKIIAIKDESRKALGRLLCVSLFRQNIYTEWSIAFLILRKFPRQTFPIFAKGGG